jgi:hypothetical protein
MICNLYGHIFQKIFIGDHLSLIGKSIKKLMPLRRGRIMFGFLTGLYGLLKLPLK